MKKIVIFTNNERSINIIKKKKYFFLVLNYLTKI